MRARVRAALGLGGLAAALAAAGCGGGGPPVRIGLLAECTGALAAFGDLELSAAELPLLARGGRLTDGRPSGGVTGSRVGGKRVELVLGCGEWSTYRVLIAEARRLLEREHVDVLISAGGDSDGVVFRELAHHHPGVAFMLSLSRAQQSTLRRPAPNLFRFQADGAQEAAGLGSYAYHKLGWRTAAVVADDTSTAWDRVAGFVAEFCALGGRVVSRSWTPGGAPLPESLAAKVSRADGVALLPGPAFLDWSGFARGYARIHPDLAQHLILGPETLILPAHRSTAARFAPGVVAADYAPYNSQNAAWLRLQRESRRWFPGLPALTSPAEVPLASAFYNAMEATLQGLEDVRGVLSDGERRFMRTLAQLELDSPAGPIRLDARRQAIAPTYLNQVQRGGNGAAVVRTLHVLPNVEQTFNGYFTPSTPAPTQTAPACHRARPPAWALKS